MNDTTATMEFAMLTDAQRDKLRSAVGPGVEPEALMKWADALLMDHALLENLLRGFTLVTGTDEAGDWLFTMTPAGVRHVEQMGRDL